MNKRLKKFSLTARRINERLQTMYNKLGSESKPFQDMVRDLDVQIPDTNLRYNREGVLQIANPSKLYKDKDIRKAVQKLDKSLTTWGDLRKSYEKDYERSLKNMKTDIEEGFAEPYSIETYINVEESLPSIITDVSKENEEVDEKTEKALQILKKSHNTYSELEEVIRIMGA